MTRSMRLMRVGMLGAVLLVVWGMLVNAGESQRTPVRQYTGQIKSIKIDRCGLQPGTCEGSVVLSLQGGQEVSLAILPGTWIKRGDQLVVIGELYQGPSSTFARLGPARGHCGNEPRGKGSDARGNKPRVTPHGVRTDEAHALDIRGPWRFERSWDQSLTHSMAYHRPAWQRHGMC